MNCTCALHKKNSLTLFCQTCLDAICVQCRDQNPHSDQFHKILTLEESVNQRKLFFGHFIDMQINPIKQKIGQKFKQLKNLQEAKIVQKNVIVKDIMLQFQNIENRVRQNQHKKSLQLQTEIKYYQDYLNTLDDLAYSFQKTMKDPYNFLILYKDFNKLLEKLESKQIVQQNSTKAQWLNTLKKQEFKQDQIPSLMTQNSKEVFQNKDLQLIPRQIKQTYNFLQILPSLHDRNCLMNSLLLKASALYKQQIKNANKFHQTQTKRILNLYNQYNRNVLSLKTAKTCCYCQASFSIETCNDQCSQNKAYKSQVSPKYTKIIVPVQCKGSKRHFWVDTEICNRNRPDVASHPLVRNKLKRQFFSSLEDLKTIQCCFRKYQIQKNEDFIKVFIKQDKQNKQRLSKIKFKFILTKTFQMKQIHSEMLINLLFKDQEVRYQQICEGEQKLKKQSIVQAGIDYICLLKLAQNPMTYYDKYLEQEEQLDKTKPIAPQSFAKKYLY